MKKTSLLLLAILALGIGAYLGTQNLFSTKLTVEEESRVLLERVKTVCKLVTVEGEFSDIYSHKDYYWQDIGLFRKKALLKVKAKVAVGYDLENYEFEMRHEDKTVLISKLADPEVLYIDTEIGYYDISEGTFNSFNPAELTAINKKAKEQIRKKALSGNLQATAEKQAAQIDDLIKVMVEQSGWKVEYKPRTDLLD